MFALHSGTVGLHSSKVASTPRAMALECSQVGLPALCRECRLIAVTLELGNLIIVMVGISYPYHA
jgi:hypothetical protein